VHIFSKLQHDFFNGTKAVKKSFGLFPFSQKLPKENNRPMDKNSSKLAALFKIRTFM
jgi:hypothetical protein